jgi:hypothetical protein
MFSIAIEIYSKFYLRNYNLWIHLVGNCHRWSIISQCWYNDHRSQKCVRFPSLITVFYDHCASVLFSTFCEWHAKMVISIEHNWLISVFIMKWTVMVNNSSNIIKSPLTSDHWLLGLWDFQHYICCALYCVQWCK